MKNIALIILISTALLATSLSVQDIDNKVAKIQATRDGMNVAMLDKTSDPFVYFERNATTGAIITPKEENAITLNAIMNGKAYIGDSWKRVGDKAGNYTIKSIRADMVILGNGSKTKKLFIGNKQENNLIKLQGR